MAFCKICPCGNTITFATRSSFPEQCPYCSRRIRDFILYREGDPQITALLAQFANTNNTLNEDAIEETGDLQNTEKTSTTVKAFVLVSLGGGYEIVIPPEGGIVGRGGIGAKHLIGNEAVSREHLRITPRKNAGVIIQDISTYGTMINGKPIIRDIPIRTEVNSRITLYNEEFVLQEKEVECSD